MSNPRQNNSALSEAHPVHRRCKLSDTNKENRYFGDQEEKLIRQFKRSADTDRKKIFTDLYPKFDYLVTSLMHNFKIPQHFEDVEGIKQDCITSIFEGISKYNPYKKSKVTGKVSKFYSYCSVIVSNHLRQLIKKKKHQQRFDDTLSGDYVNHYMCSHGLSKLSMPSPENEIEQQEYQTMIKEFVCVLQKNMELWESYIVKENDKKVYNAIVKLTEDASVLDTLDKKEIFILIREITGLKPQQINGSLKNIRKLYISIKQQYLDY